VNQAPKVSAGGIGTVAESDSASAPGPNAGSSATEPIGSSATNSQSNKANFPTTAVSQATADSVTSRPFGSAAGTDSANISLAKSAAPSNALVSSPADEVVEKPKKPALGQVRLAAPKVMRRAADSEYGSADPGLAMNGTTPADSNSLSLLSSKSKTPAAPLPVGGDVKVANLISSVPPVYPQMARTQRVSGDVTVDALIDTNGHVTTTRVISGPALLHDAAMSAVKQWKYQPATLNGIPTPTHLTVTVQFKLQ